MAGPGAADTTAWALNVLSSVLIVFVNKWLMDPNWGYGFVFATTLCAFHFFASAATVKASEALGFSVKAKLPLRDALVFSVVAGASIAALNLSLLVNTVGFYQISKLLIIPFVTFVEAIWLRRRFTVLTLCCILVVVIGVGIVTVTDMAISSLSALGLLIAAISVVASGMQQIMCGTLQRRYNLTSTQLLSNTAPVQGLLLLLTGPLVDQVVTGSSVFHYVVTAGRMRCLALSCGVAVLVNISQFMCLGRFSAVTFQVLGHTKTLLVLLVGWAFLHDVMTSRKVVGMALAMAGMVGYGIVGSKSAPAAPAAPGPGRVPGAARSRLAALMTSLAAPLGLAGKAAGSKAGAWSPLPEAGPKAYVSPPLSPAASETPPGMSDWRSGIESGNGSRRPGLGGTRLHSRSPSNSPQAGREPLS